MIIYGQVNQHFYCEKNGHCLGFIPLWVNGILQKEIYPTKKEKNKNTLNEKMHRFQKLFTH